MNQNLARAVGPAIGGVLLAATSAGALFLVNAASFAAVIAVLVMWHSATRARTRCRASTSARRSGPAAGTSRAARSWRDELAG